jgi:phosphopentomutase
MKRACVIVLDSVGVGALPDAAAYGDAGAHTLGNVAAANGGLCIPNLTAMGLGNIEDARIPGVAEPTAAYGRMAMQTRAKDTTSGHWEMMGLITEPPFATVTHFTDEFLTRWLTHAGYESEPKWLGNCAASGTEIIDRLGAEHVATRAPIVYTSADSVFQVAAHEGVIPLEMLYKLCECARELLNTEPFIGRVIARPFTGDAPGFARTENRKDYAVPPTGATLLDELEKHGRTTLGIGKIEDIFSLRGVTHVDHTTNNTDGIAATIKALRDNTQDSLIFTNLVDFDMKYGHRCDAVGYAKCLEEFDARLPEIISAMREGDALFITADHGCDPTHPGTDHTREYVPILAYGAGFSPVSVGTRATFADLAATLAHGFGMPAWGIGQSFFESGNK